MDATVVDAVVREVGVDGGAAAPTGLAATVVDRRRTSFRLSWIAPGANGQAVSGYVIRVSKTALSEATFDDPSNAAVIYGGTPATPGSPDGVDVSPLYIETDYFFAVAAYDASNNRGPIAATSSPVRATFQVASLTGTNGGEEQFGYQLDSGDADQNGVSDLLVGSFTGKRAYLYLNAIGATPTTATVVFNGDATTTASFGRGIAFIGDVDDDGREDLAIADRGTPSRVFIFRGRATWPLTLSSADADFVVSVDATYNNSIFGGSMARLGDFNGDGVDDFAIGASVMPVATQQGRVVIVLGRSGFTSVALPDPARTIVVDGDPAIMTSQFGYRVLGLGHFYSVTIGTTLIASAPGNTASAAGNEGRLYAFHGQTGTAGSIPIGSADHMVAGPPGDNRIGIVVSNLGRLSGALPSLGSGNPTERVTTVNGNAYVFIGTAAGGPFARRQVVTQSGAGLSGMALIGGGVSGRDESHSFIGDPTPDLVIAARDSPTFAIVDGRTVTAGAATTIDANAIAEVRVALPTDWTATGEAQGVLLPDSNGDGYADFALANAIGAVPGRVLVYR